MSSNQEKIVILALFVLGLGLIGAGLYYSPQNVQVGDWLKRAGYCAEDLAGALILRKALISCLSSCRSMRSSTNKNGALGIKFKKPSLSEFEELEKCLLDAANFGVPYTGQLASCSVQDSRLLHHVDVYVTTFHQSIYKGQFLEGNRWFLIKFKQKDQSGWVDNFLLVIDQKGQHPRVMTKPGVPSILFDYKYTKDLERLMDIITNGSGKLRKDATSYWDIDMGYTKSR